MPLYVYKDLNTEEVFEEIRSMADRDNPFISPITGNLCERVAFPGGTGVRDKNAEGFESDPEYYKNANPKYVKYRDGHRERYDPIKHCK